MFPTQLDGENFTILPGNQGNPLVITCEHAANAIPWEYNNLGLSADILNSHWGWDIGAWATCLRVASALNVTLVGSHLSRLLVDLNRGKNDKSLIVESIQSKRIPGNYAIPRTEREARIQRYYTPYHNAIEEVLTLYQQKGPTLLISIHSFTPKYGNQDRDFDIGVLFDRYNEDLARHYIGLVASTGLSVRENEPYSGLKGEIYSVAHHGRRENCQYFEIEINQRCISTELDRRKMSEKLQRTLSGLLEYYEQLSRSAIR